MVSSYLYMLYIVYFMVSSFFYMLNIVNYMVSSFLYILFIVYYMMQSFLYVLYIVHFIVPLFLYMLSIVHYIMSALLYMLFIVHYMMSSLLYTRDDQNVLDPLYFELPGNEKLTITFEYNLPSRQCTCPISVRAFLPLQKKAFSWSPKYSFTASMTPSLLPYCVPRRWDFSSRNR